ncbi:FAD:protein FMN transferase [Pseudonocardia adelaidensis]|uniref:FAD:protein FMN transferase n=1 Tax=Pseudonocardia adelaidensis TaxID=648754 RepID=A0ABP9NF89_9PSEU
MTISLHTGIRTATVSSAWTAWDAPFRLVVTDPWAMHHARLHVTDLVGALVASVGRRLPPARRDARLAELLGGTCPAPRPFPYGIASAAADADVHRPAPVPWQQEFTAAARARDGWTVAPGPSAAALLAQRCAELVAESCSCGVLVAFGDHVATSGLAPVGGWRVQLRDAPGAPTTIVAIDGGAISSVGCGRPGQPDRLQPFVVPATGRAVVPAWRSVAVAAADAPAASAACTGALLRGAAAPAWLAELGLPARLVDVHGVSHRVGHWPA